MYYILSRNFFSYKKDTIHVKVSLGVQYIDLLKNSIELQKGYILHFSYLYLGNKPLKWKYGTGIKYFRVYFQLYFMQRFRSKK